MIICIFATREPAKPLNDAQMCEVFIVYTHFSLPSFCLSIVKNTENNFNKFS